jgi:hypothetical protein
MVRFSEEDRTTIWDIREAGVPVTRAAKHLDRRGRRSDSARSSASPWKSVRRSLGAWLRACPSGPSPTLDRSP